MLYFIKNILVLLAASFASCFIFIFGIPYSAGHSIVMSFKKDWKTFFRLLSRLISGTFHAFGYVIFHLAKFQDILWNVWAGELFEDIVTTREDTDYGTFTTISEATGKESMLHKKKITSAGNWFIKGLNVIFGQKKHAEDAYELGVKRSELESKYYH